ncbi:MAG: hypothetical protein NC078_01660 [Ruminococcus sp.]|nr:hypothetical protein [Ruminococcus sp.]
MSVIIGGRDITGYINLGGISESVQLIAAADGGEQSKGAHFSYSVTAQMPSDIKDIMAKQAELSNVFCNVGREEFYGEMTGFTAAVAVEYGDMLLWNVSFTVTDNALS